MASEASRNEPVAVSRTETLATALERMLAEGVDHLVVVDAERRLEGILTRTDILKARVQRIEQERSQAGWLAMRRDSDALTRAAR